MTRQTTIVLVGPPAVGKSTQATILASELKARGYRVRAAKTSSFVLLKHTRPLMLILSKMFVWRRRNASPPRILLESPSVFRGLFKLWLLADILLVHARFLLQVYVPWKLGYSIIIEFDWFCWLAIYFHLRRSLGLPSSHIDLDRAVGLLHLVQPKRILLLDAEEGALESRWNRRDSRANIAEMRECLHILRSLALPLASALHTDLVRVNSGNPSQTSRNILQALSDLFSDTTVD